MRRLVKKVLVIAVLLSLILSPTAVVYGGEEDIPRVFNVANTSAN